MNDRDEALRDRIATVIQAGHSSQKTSHDVAGEVLDLVIKEVIALAWAKKGGK